MTCPQCKEEIVAIDAKTYWVGWCQKEVHCACYLLHARGCTACRPHNLEAIMKQAGV